MSKSCIDYQKILIDSRRPKAIHRAFVTQMDTKNVSPNFSRYKVKLRKPLPSTTTTRNYITFKALKTDDRQLARNISEMCLKYETEHKQDDLVS